MTDIPEEKGKLTLKQLEEVINLFDEAEQLAQKSLLASNDLLVSAMRGKWLDQTIGSKIHECFYDVKRTFSLIKERLHLIKENQ
jgi:hypothetical protein